MALKVKNFSFNDGSLFKGSEFIYSMPTTNTKFRTPDGAAFPISGGFVAEVDTRNRSMALKQLVYLKSSGWIDLQTSIVIIELMFYNHNINRACLVRLMVRTAIAGEIQPSSKFTSFAVFPYDTNYGNLQLSL